MTDDTETDHDGDGDGARADAASSATIDRLARQYVAENRPFARVTVVRREPPVSARVGDRAVVTADGDLTGWIGGVACAQSVAVREAREAIRSGESKLIGIAPDPATIDRPGLDAFPMTCHSQGTIELFVEPVTPLARLVIVGDSPISRALARLAATLSYDVTVVAPEGTEPIEADRRLAATEDAAALAEEIHGATWVVAASMGTTDDVAVEAALDAGVPYVGLVASRRRADELCRRVADRTGRPAEEVRAAVTSPAGVDIDARTPEEIGVSVLAELVAVRHAAGDRPVSRAGADGHGDDSGDAGGIGDDAEKAGGDAEEAGGDTREADDGSGEHDAVDAESDTREPAVAVDPVCGMDVTVGEAAATATHEGRTYHFCGEGCRDAFVDDPERFVERAEP
ncbi:XdhC family protein [Salinigranum salinum]|uniref:XdhC family protein n=1 Tax=Salinigranum salinum TaxID=1364937 RepID=UPI0018646294|nr:XdhC family protein [Salinigranum salinum]